MLTKITRLLDHSIFIISSLPLIPIKSMSVSAATMLFTEKVACVLYLSQTRMNSPVMLTRMRLGFCYCGDFPNICNTDIRTKHFRYKS